MKTRGSQRTARTIKSYTLMEMVVVIAIIAMLATVVTPLYFRHVKKARVNTAQTQIKLIEQAIFDFRLDTAKLPTSLNDLMTNSGGYKKWEGPYLKQAIPKDPWGNDYLYACPGQHGEFDLSSNGADGQTGGSGENADISNWAATAE